MMQVLDTGTASAAENMRFDEKLLSELDPGGEPILHLYDWSGLSATYGYFIDPKKHLDLEKAAAFGLQLARRPTGGGIVFHIWDLAFSFLMPSAHPAFSLNTLTNYQFVNRAVLAVLEEFFQLNSLELTPENGISLGPDCQNFCMAKPTQYDVVYQGMKLAGAAQRKRKQGYLHQGTISLATPRFDLLNEVLLSKEEVVEAMRSFTFAPLARVTESNRAELQKLLAEKLQDSLKF